MEIPSLTDLPIEEQVGQLFFVGLAGPELTATERAMIKHVRPGGFVIFGRNVAAPGQVRNLLDEIRGLLNVEPLLGIDQEGGLVDRLRKICTPMPPARTIREHGDLAAARTLGRVTGEILRILGFNLNFAPVMEIMTDDRDLLSNGLYSRAFGRSPGEVLGYAMVYLRGLQRAGCLGCLKHFPGIGAGEVDSHEEMPLVHLTHDDLIAQDLAPYIELFQREDERVRALMVSHGGFPKVVDIHHGVAGGRIEPASINYQITTQLLREELGYRHLVMTDDLEMGAISKHYVIEETVRRAFDAGQDMLLICSKLDEIHRGYDEMVKAVKEGEISRERLNRSLRNIDSFKRLAQPALPFDIIRFQELSAEIATLNRKLNYTYKGKIQ